MDEAWILRRFVHGRGLFSADLQSLTGSVKRVRDMAVRHRLDHQLEGGLNMTIGLSLGYGVDLAVLLVARSQDGHFQTLRPRCCIVGYSGPLGAGPCSAA